MADDFTERYGDLINGSYDRVDRIVLNAFFSIGHNPGGFRCWWRRLHGGSDDQLDDTHLMRMAGRFARRVKAWAAANGVPVIFCTAGERKHLIAEQYLEENSVAPGVFLVLAARAPAGVQKVHRSARGVITRLEKKREHACHYSFHIMDPVFGAPGDQDVRAPAVRRAGDSQRARVRRGHRAGRGDRLCQGGELLTRKLGPRWARGSEPWPVRWQGCGMALVIRRAMAGVPGRRRLRCWGNQGLRLLAGR